MRAVKDRHSGYFYITESDAKGAEGGSEVEWVLCEKCSYKKLCKRFSNQAGGCWNKLMEPEDR